MICDPRAPLPPLAGTRLVSDGEITPAMKAWADALAGDLRIPIGTTARGTFSSRDGQPLRIVARVECHAFRVNADGSRTPGAFHGTTLYVDTTPELKPSPARPAPPDARALAIFGTFGIAVACAARGLR